MSLSATAVAAPDLGSLWVKSRFSTLLDWIVAFWIFLGCVVITEPAPYELVFFLVFGVSLFAGSFAFRRSTLGLLILWALFIPFAIIGAFQGRYNPLLDALQFQLVTIFLFFTSYWVANYVAEAPQARMRLIIAAYIACATISALLGTLGYLGVIPGHDLFTRYDRAKALFNDPNVFAFLRRTGDTTVLVALNMSGQERTVAFNLADQGVRGTSVVPLYSSPTAATQTLDRVVLPPFGSLVATVK